MGSITSKLTRTTEDNFEKILADLDANIRTVELGLAETMIRQRRLFAIATTYSLLSYLVYLVYYVFVGRHHFDERDLYSWVWASLAGFGWMTTIVFRGLIAAWYGRQLRLQEETLDTLKKKQKLKVEELKKKTSYYATKGLIERYENPTKNPSNLQKPSRRKSNPKDGGVPSTPPSRLPPQAYPQTEPKPHTMPVNFHGGPVPPPQFGPPGSQNQPPQNAPMGYRNQSPQLPRNSVMMSAESLTTQRTWVDKLMDLIVGEDTPNNKYALICEKCFAHNGLALPEDHERMRYVCPKCGHLNQRKKTTGLDDSMNWTNSIRSSDRIVPSSTESLNNAPSHATRPHDSVGEMSSPTSRDASPVSPVVEPTGNEEPLKSPGNTEDEHDGSASSQKKNGSDLRKRSSKNA